MNKLISLNKQTMSFERKLLHVVVPLDPAEGPRYTEPVHDYKSDDDHNARSRLSESES